MFVYLALETGEEQWANYCDAQGGGVRDPGKHDASFMQSFLAAYKEARSCLSSARWSVSFSVCREPKQFLLLHGNATNPMNGLKHRLKTKRGLKRNI